MSENGMYSMMVLALLATYSAGRSVTQRSINLVARRPWKSTDLLVGMLRRLRHKHQTLLSLLKLPFHVHTIQSHVRTPFPSSSFTTHHSASLAFLICPLAS